MKQLATQKNLKSLPDVPPERVVRVDVLEELCWHGLGWRQVTWRRVCNQNLRQEQP